MEDRFIDLTTDERGVYEAVEEYIRSTYNQAESSVRNAVGFVMTVYRRRLASSFHALGATLRKRVAGLGDLATLTSMAEDVPDDETAGDVPDADDIFDLERRALVAEEQADIADLLAAVEALPPDSKLGGPGGRGWMRWTPTATGR